MGNLPPPHSSRGVFGGKEGLSIALWHRRQRWKAGDEAKAPPAGPLGAFTAPAGPAVFTLRG